jgi:hypothetical protein
MPVCSKRETRKSIAMLSDSRMGGRKSVEHFSRDESFSI